MKENTDRLLAAMERLLHDGLIAPGAFEAAHDHCRALVQGGTPRGVLKASELIPDAAGSRETIGRRLLKLFDERVVEREVVLQKMAEMVREYRRERDEVKRVTPEKPPMDFIRVNSGSVSAKGRTVVISEPFEVQSTPLLSEHWHGPLAESFSPEFIPPKDQPLSFWMREIPELLAAINAHDSRYSYTLMSHDQWFYLTLVGGGDLVPPKKSRTHELLDYAWLHTNSASAVAPSMTKGTRYRPHWTLPVHGRMAFLIHGQPIWGLLGNMLQVVVPPKGVRSELPQYDLVGGNIFKDPKMLRTPYFWKGTDSGGRGAVRLIRTARRTDAFR